MSHYKLYPAYKDSGVEWIGRVPEHWTVRRLKFSISSCQNGVWGDEPTGSGDTPCVRVADFDRSALRVNQEIPTLRAIPERDRANRVLRRGNLLLEKSGGGERQPVGQVVLYDCDAEAVCSNFIARIVLSDGADSSFWCYQFAGAYACGLNLRSVKQTSGIQNLDQEQYLDEMATCPPPAEQSAIAAALDRETAGIDALIARKTHFIELLKEKRQALITHAVTKGLDPSVKMKDSGVEWIGKVPLHWDSVPIRRVAKLESGHTPSRSEPSYWVNCTIPWFTLADIWQVRKEGRVFVSETTEKVSELGVANSSARKLPAGTVILSRTASVGFPAIMGCEMATSQDFAAWVCGDRLSNEFLYLCLVAMRDELGRLTMGSTHKTIYMPDIEQLRCPLPPILEQKRILEFVSRQTKRFDELMVNVEHSITLLKERRSALITAAVTGQIDLREAA
jgi:type I restriction enzyme S subunit